MRQFMLVVLCIASTWLGAMTTVNAVVASREVQVVASASATIYPDIKIDRITHYQAVPEQTDSDPFTSSCGPNKPKQVAVSRDLMGTVVECGSLVQVWSTEHGNLGTYTVWDVTNARFSKTVDILTDGPTVWGKTSGHIVLLDNQYQ